MAVITAHHSFLQRLVGALALDRAIYEEVEADPRATLQALLIVLASSVAAGLGVRGAEDPLMSTVLVLSAVALMTWAAWALLVFQIGTRMMPDRTTRSDVGELLRTLGFAATPGLLRVLGLIPDAMWPVLVVTTAWMLAAMVVAVRQALDYHSTAKALAVCGFGLLLSLTMAIVLGVLFGPTLT